MEVYCEKTYEGPHSVEYTMPGFSFVLVSIEREDFEGLGRPDFVYLYVDTVRSGERDNSLLEK